MALNVKGAAEYQAVLEKINLWYGSNAQQVIDAINQYELTPQQVAQDYLSGSGFEPWYTTSGAVGGYNSAGTTPLNSATAVQEAVNSNTGAATETLTKLKTPVETTIDSNGKVKASSGLTSVATGAKSGLTFITKEVLPAISAAGLGIALGKTIDTALYNINPDFWDNAGMSSLNPQTWNSITQDYPDGFLKKAFNTIFGLNPTTGETQQYLDQDAVAYLAQYMQEKGVFDTGDMTARNAHYGTSEQSQYFNYSIYTQPISIGASASYKRKADPKTTYTWGGGTYAGIFYTPSRFVTALISKNPFTVTEIAANPDTGQTHTYTYTAGQIAHTKTGETFYCYVETGLTPYDYEFISAANRISMMYRNEAQFLSDFYTFTFGGTVSGGGGVDGMPTQDGATTPDFSNCTTPQDYLNALQAQYPDMFNNAVTQSVVNADGTTSTKKYLPIGTSSQYNNNNKTQPVTTGENSGNSQSSQSADPATVDLTGLQNLINQLTQTISKTGTPDTPSNPDPTGTGGTPVVTPPTGSAASLWAVYNPSQGELNSFGAWLWSSNFIDQILKLFNNPMQSIIGVHKIFATPPTSGSASIKVGYLDSGVSANVVSSQYVTIDCGGVNVREQFGNVFDYEDTQIRLYLPFIGIVQLDTNDVMRGSVKVVYHVDVITGACLAEVRVTRDASGGTLYQFSGDAAVRYPISSGSYMGVVSGVLGVVGGIASGIMSGGATLPMAAGAIAGGLSGAKTQVQHSGSFAGNAGAMGAKKPYLIIERPQTALTDGFGAYQGVGANRVALISSMTGYFKMADIHTDSIAGAAESEIEAIRAALAGGVIA